MILNILVLLASRRLYCFSQVHKKTQEVMGQPKGGAYLQARVQFAQVQLRASMRVKGMVAAKRRSARTRCRMKMFLAVLITARRRTATITSRFPKTGKLAMKAWTFKQYKNSRWSQIFQRIVSHKCFYCIQQRKQVEYQVWNTHIVTLGWRRYYLPCWIW